MRHPGPAPIFVLLLAVAGCVPLPELPPIPPVRAERVPAPPPAAETLIWQPGHYDWDGTNYVWVHGRWVTRAGHGPLWQDGFWRRTPAGPVWEAAHWL